jgi:hypothetical protein
MKERRLRNRVIPIATFSPLCQDMNNPPTPSSPLQRVPTNDRDDRLAHIEQALSLLADRLAVLTTTSPPVHGNPIDPVVPDQDEDVPMIPVGNRRYAEVLAVQNYRLRDRAQGLRPEQVATLTNVANQIRPRLDGLFTVEIRLLPFYPFFVSWLKLQINLIYPKLLCFGLSRSFCDRPRATRLGHNNYSIGLVLSFGYSLRMFRSQLSMWLFGLCRLRVKTQARTFENSDFDCSYEQRPYERYFQRSK